MAAISKLCIPDAVSDKFPLYIIKISVIAILSASLLSTALTIAMKSALHSMPLPPERDDSPLTWLLVVGLGPLVESALLYACCRFAFTNFPKRQMAAAIVIGIAAGALHALVSPLWFFGPAVSFFIWSIAWFNWRSAQRTLGFLIILVPHMLQNAASMFLMT